MLGSADSLSLVMNTSSRWVSIAMPLKTGAASATTRTGLVFRTIGVLPAVCLLAERPLLGTDGLLLSRRSRSTGCLRISSATVDLMDAAWLPPFLPFPSSQRRGMRLTVSQLWSQAFRKDHESRKNIDIFRAR